MAQQKLDLKTISTMPPEKFDKKSTRKKTEKLKDQLNELQAKLFAEKKYSLLIILQGLDASGKDGAIKKVFKAVNPIGCIVKSFEVPTPIETSYDFLWRVHKEAPPKGMLTIFNRSHYEDVLVPVVEKQINEAMLKKRYRFINFFEELLTEENNTIILKFYLHISKKEQQESFKERITNPKKKWKYNESDLITTEKRTAFLKAYESIFENCNQYPWHIVPADKNWYKEYFIAKTIVDVLEKFDLKYPDFKDLIE